MLNRDERCVYVGNTLAEADIVAAWLCEQGVPARAMGAAISGGLDLNPWGGKGVSPRGIEVWVQDETQVELAVTLLEQREAAAASASPRELPTEPIDLACEECGEIATYAADLVGTTQECNECGAFLDVQDGSEADEDEWWAVTEEESDEGAEADLDESG